MGGQNIPLLRSAEIILLGFYRHFATTWLQESILLTERNTRERLAATAILTPL